MELLKILGALITLVGSVFLLLGAIGTLRMPDSYNRIQAGTKATTLGTMCSLLGIAVYHPDWLGKILLLILFVMLTNPISSHALARAAHFINIPLAKETIVDKLKERESAVQDAVVEEVQ
jgi:multicomponent Na+:H+ antiporter subunit G